MARFLQGLHILVVDDEFLAALDMAEMVVRQGATVVGPVGRLAPAIELALAEPIDGAILDVRLDGEVSFPLADLLLDRGVPLLFATGYDGTQLPERFALTPRIAKPCAESTVARALHELFGSI